MHAGNVTCGAKLENEGKAQETGGKIQNNLGTPSAD